MYHNRSNIVDFSTDISDAIDNVGDVLTPMVIPDTPSLHTPCMYNGNSQITARDDHTAILCGCRGHYFWELIPATNITFYRGTAPDTVDRCVSSVHVYKTFSEAFWAGYGQCVTDCKDPCFTMYVRDWSLAVYQLHDNISCPRHYTRYTLGSIKKFIQYNEQLRLNPVLGAFCQCRCNLPSENIAYNVCFTCLQSVLELKACSLVGVKEHFSYEVNFKDGFLSALLPGARNNRLYFIAQALFEKGIASTKTMRGGLSFINTWTTKIENWEKLLSLTPNNSFCMLCWHGGNGFQAFMCSNCTENKMLS